MTDTSNRTKLELWLPGTGQPGVTTTPLDSGSPHPSASRALLQPRPHPVPPLLYPNPADTEQVEGMLPGKGMNHDALKAETLFPNEHEAFWKGSHFPHSIFQRLALRWEMPTERNSSSLCPATEAGLPCTSRYHPLFSNRAPAGAQAEQLTHTQAWAQPLRA